MSEIKSVLLWENQRRYVREAIDAGTLKGAIIPTGSTEQHNEHLAMYHDTQSAVYVSKLAAEKLFPQVIVTTPLAIGVSEHWMDHKGTLTLRAEVFGEVLYDVADSMRRHGIDNILIVNGHAGIQVLCMSGWMAIERNSALTSHSIPIGRRTLKSWSQNRWNLGSVRDTPRNLRRHLPSLPLRKMLIGTAWIMTARNSPFPMKVKRNLTENTTIKPSLPQQRKGRR